MTQQKTERKNNKKTAVIVALLLALIALLCFGGYTFSKYVTSGKGSGTANVAKWGYTASVDTTKLFGEEYKYDAAKVASTVDGTGANLTVKADPANESNLVAPGTTGSMTFKVGGKAEVRALLSMGIDVHTYKDVVLKIKKTGETAYTEYHPVKWTLKKNDGAVTVAEKVTLAKVAEKIAEEGINKAYAPNEELTTTTYELSWAWEFEGTESVLDLSIDQLDTILGQMAAGVTGYTPAGYEIDATSSTELAFTFTIQVTQLAF
mgnify:CR=1 FL=1